MTTKIQKGNASLSPFASVVGGILAISYPVLGISALFRAGYQLFLKEGVVNYNGPILSGIAAFVYIVAAAGFAYQRKWAWRVSVVALAFELIMVLVIGVVTVSNPDLLGRTVWGNFGADYAFFPLIQPLLGLIWLFRRETREVYELT